MTTRKRPRVTSGRTGSIAGLRDPADVGAFRTPYRDAGPGLHGGNVLFGPGLSSADKDINRYRDKGVANARHADRNNSLINSGLTKRATNAVGANLRLQYLPNWAALGVDENSPTTVEFVQAVENHFSLWAEDFRFLCDAQRQGQFGALMLLAARDCFGTEGETLIICRYDEERQQIYRGEYATFIEVVNCDRLSNPDWYSEGSPSGPRIISGKEVDDYGAAYRFHVEVTHPDQANGVRRWEAVERETEWGRPIGIHFFGRHRSGQQRNMPSIIQSLRNVKMLEDFDNAQLETAVINAILSIYVESEGTTEEVLQKLQTATPTGGRNLLADMWDKRFDFYEENQLNANGARIPVLPPGDKIQMSTASRASADTKDFRSAFIRSIATQLNLTYEQLSGDYSETTFSSARAAMIDVWRLITVDRILFTQHVAYPIFAAFMEEIYVRSDELGVPWPAEWPDFYENMTAFTQCEFRGPGMGWVDPEKDINAAGKRQQQGLTSPTYEAAVQGQDFRDNVDQIARDHAYARLKGVIIPGMPEFAAMNNPNAAPEDAAGAAAANEEEADNDRAPADEEEARAAELRDQEDRTRG